MKECEGACGTPEQLERLQAVIEESRTTPGCLMHILQEAQGIYGFLPMSVQKTIAEGLGISLSEVYGVVTFYDEGEYYGLARATISLNGQTYQFTLDTENYDSACFEKLVAKLHEFLPESERQKQINQESWALLTRRIMQEETLLRRLQEAKLYADAMIGK